MEALSLQSFQTLENSIMFIKLWRQYRDYIIDFNGVKDSTMSYSKCTMPSLSFFSLFIPSLYPSFLNSNKFYFIVLTE